MANPADSQAAIFYYQGAYKIHYGEKPVVNYYKLTFAFGAVIDDIGLDETRELIDFYFKTLSNDRHNPETFARNYDKLINSRAEQGENNSRLAALKEQTRLRAEEWRKTHKTLGDK